MPTSPGVTTVGLTTAHNCIAKPVSHCSSGADNLPSHAPSRTASEGTQRWLDKASRETAADKPKSRPPEERGHLLACLHLREGLVLVELTGRHSCILFKVIVSKMEVEV